LFALTYDLWQEIIDKIALAHDSLFSAMHQAAEDLVLTSAMIEDLKDKKELKVADDSWEFLLMIDFVEDEIGGFSVILVAKEELVVLEQIKANVVSDLGFSLEDIEGFELEHGLDLQEEIFVEIEERYGVRAEAGEDSVIYEMVIFDSQDIDNSQYSEQVWQEDIDN
jgi:hypothetical protein